MEKFCLLAQPVVTFCPLSPSIQKLCGDLGLRAAKKRKSMIARGRPFWPFLCRLSFIIEKTGVSAILPFIINHGLVVYLLMEALLGKNPRPHPTQASV